MKYKRKEVIGDCVLYLGDSQEILPVLEFDCVVSDPPFGMSFLSNHRKAETTHKKITNDDNVELLQWICELDIKHSKYIFCRWDNLKDVKQPKSVITWIKNNHSMGDLKHEHGRQTELCLFYAGQKHFFPKGRPNDVIKCERTGNNHHPTEKPISLMQAIIEWTSGVIIDPFMGSASTLVACAKMGRKGIGIELDEDYFDIACKRVEEAYKSPDLFIEAEKKEVKQEALCL